MAPPSRVSAVALVLLLCACHRADQTNSVPGQAQTAQTGGSMTSTQVLEHPQGRPSSDASTAPGSLGGTAAPAQAYGVPAASTAPAPPGPHVRVTAAVVQPGQLGETLDPHYSVAIRPGLWRTVQTMANGSVQTNSTCESGRPTPIRFPFACPSMRLNRTLTGGFALAASCTPGRGVRAEMSIHAEGDFQTYYSGQTQIYATGPRGSLSQTVHMESVWVGPCTGHEGAGGGAMGGSVNGESGVRSADERSPPS